jgi:hypothetical protein
MPSIRPTMASSALRNAVRSYSTPATKAPRHLMTIADLTPNEFTTLVRNAASHKKEIKSGSIPQNLNKALMGKTVALTFSKRSTRTRISTEGMIKFFPPQIPQLSEFLLTLFLYRSRSPTRRPPNVPRKRRHPTRRQRIPL